MRAGLTVLFHLKSQRNPFCSTSPSLQLIKVSQSYQFGLVSLGLKQLLTAALGWIVMISLLQESDRTLPICAGKTNYLSSHLKRGMALGQQAWKRSGRAAWFARRAWGSHPRTPISFPGISSGWLLDGSLASAPLVSRRCESSADTLLRQFDGIIWYCVVKWHAFFFFFKWNCVSRNQLDQMCGCLRQGVGGRKVGWRCSKDTAFQL